MLLALAGCTTSPPPLVLPPAAASLDPDPVRAAIRGAQAAFADPAALAGRPREAAVAVAQLEFLSVEIMAGRTSIDLSGIIGPALEAARHEVRGQLGIPDSAPPQAVIDALLAEPPALAQPAIFTLGPEETLRRLSSLPRLPQANAATLAARTDMEFGPMDIDTAR
ncbi:hypothetical protein [Roseomonas marmotae]|uniref:Uncharacterized protein n=1 Tax=Roseomonas marmotae TaxID=2768161 RepID=A0ABS3K8G8_9PROT|nr:hypothetical protein [Roseomonas marmotae]MBO1073759.1 hypothetical protein [Roseomonas marmotae]QTI78609.1 hypothetical protein IAI58_13145 [Roseomonas marmotae]